MKINEKIISRIEKNGLPLDDTLGYFILLYFDCKVSYIDENLRRKANALGIIEDEEGTIKWNVSLFEKQETKFDWVKDEYVPLFKEANPDRGGHVRESLARMKKLFAENPEIRKDDVMGAVRLYIESTDFRYIMMPHYFICKGSGATKTETILTWIDKYVEENKVKSDRTTLNNILQ